MNYFKFLLVGGPVLGWMIGNVILLFAPLDILTKICISAFVAVAAATGAFVQYRSMLRRRSRVNIHDGRR